MSAKADAITYFTCTLGEAVGLSRDLEHLQTINNLIDHQAKTYPKGPAVAFPIPPTAQNEDGSFEIFSASNMMQC